MGSSRPARGCCSRPRQLRRRQRQCSRNLAHGCAQCLRASRPVRCWRHGRLGCSASVGPRRGCRALGRTSITSLERLEGVKQLEVTIIVLVLVTIIANASCRHSGRHVLALSRTSAPYVPWRTNITAVLVCPRVKAGLTVLERRGLGSCSGSRLAAAFAAGGVCLYELPREVPRTQGALRILHRSTSLVGGATQALRPASAPETPNREEREKERERKRCTFTPFRLFLVPSSSFPPFFSLCLSAFFFPLTHRLSHLDPNVFLLFLSSLPSSTSLFSLPDCLSLSFSLSPCAQLKERRLVEQSARHARERCLVGKRARRGDKKTPTLVRML